MTYTLTMSEDHARIVRDACEMYMRMKLGQSGSPFEMLVGLDGMIQMDTQEYCRKRDIAKPIMEAYLAVVNGLDGGRAKGIADKAEKLAYEVWGTIRHAEWEYDHGDSWDVRSRGPICESGVGLPKCEVVE